MSTVTGLIYPTALTGETFDMLAHKYYGNDFMDCAITPYNDPYADCLVFEGGEVIRIPVFSEETVSDASLAPWRR